MTTIAVSGLVYVGLPLGAATRSSCHTERAVGHQACLDMKPQQLLARLAPGGVFADVKSCHDGKALAAGGASVWRL